MAVFQSLAPIPRHLCSPVHPPSREGCWKTTSLRSTHEVGIRFWVWGADVTQEQAEAYLQSQGFRLHGYFIPVVSACGGWARADHVVFKRKGSRLLATMNYEVIHH